MSNMPEIKQRLERLTELGNNMRDQFAALSGPEGEDLKKKAKGAGTRVGIGAGTSLFGLIVMAVASLYVLTVIILLVDIALDTLWLSALIVVGGFLVIGGVIAAVGAMMAKSSAKELARATEDLKKQVKQTGEEMKTELEELQNIAKKEAQDRQRQMKQMVEKAKAAAPVAGPAAIGACLFLRFLKKRVRSRREKKRILKVIELYEARSGNEGA